MNAKGTGKQLTRLASLRKAPPSLRERGLTGWTASCSQPVLPKQLHRARLRSPLAHFLGKDHARAHNQTRKAAVEHAVAMKIDLAAIAGFEETELAGRIQPHDCSNRLAFVVLHLPLQAADMILQPTTCPFESVVDGERQIGMPLVRLRGASDIDVSAVRERQTDVDLIESTCAVMAARSFQDDPASRHTTIVLLEFGHMLGNGGPDFQTASHFSKIDFDRRLHSIVPILAGRPDNGPQCDMRQQIGDPASYRRRSTRRAEYVASAAQKPSRPRQNLERCRSKHRTAEGFHYIAISGSADRSFFSSGISVMVASVSNRTLDKVG